MDHYDLGIANFNADEVTTKLRHAHLKLEAGGTKESFKFWDPDGFLVQLNGPDYEGTWASNSQDYWIVQPPSTISSDRPPYRRDDLHRNSTEPTRSSG